MLLIAELLVLPNPSAQEMKSYASFFGGGGAILHTEGLEANGQGASTHICIFMCIYIYILVDTRACFARAYCLPPGYASKRGANSWARRKCNP